ILLASGITTVRNPAAPAADGVALREAVRSGRIAGPRIFTAGEALNRAFPDLDGPAVGVSTEAQVRREVDRQAGLRVDFIKVYGTLGPDLVKVAIGEAHARGLKVIGHLQRTSWTEAARFGIDFITHGAPWSTSLLPAARREAYDAIRGSRERIAWLEWVDLDGPEIREMVEEIGRRRIPIDPTLVAYDTKFRANDAFYTKSADLSLVPPLILKMWEGPGFTAGWSAEDFARGRADWPKVLKLLRMYRDRGVPLLAGSDTPNPWVVPGLGLHRELELLVEAGFTPLEVLTMATRNGAEALGIGNEVGTVEAGKRADLVVLTADPSSDIRNTRKIERVYLGGAAVDLHP
ncbi:MAG: amidohydrolase family protein, partial [Acidobacteria bacterium]|nr:amidohydrolase family protein [Acidobacteriota bacterium]